MKKFTLFLATIIVGMTMMITSCSKEGITKPGGGTTYPPPVNPTVPSPSQKMIDWTSSGWIRDSISSCDEDSLAYSYAWIHTVVQDNPEVRCQSSKFNQDSTGKITYGECSSNPGAVRNFNSKWYFYHNEDSLHLDFKDDFGVVYITPTKAQFRQRKVIGFSNPVRYSITVVTWKKG